MGLRGKKKWTKGEVKRKKRWNKRKIEILEYLARVKKPVDRDEVSKALKIDRDATSSILLAYYRQALVSRELPFEVPFEVRPRAKLPYHYMITPRGLKKLKWLKSK